ncbi:truncated A-type inclusion protein [Yokapox virus]|uniref:Truncated A-type inclusion protein n=1 Tax=Yokapox virus TaxID=1076255 RepID=G3EI21_9POXV|nr:truncated A-type inclusion protein [Yokapox virus]AEN03718.1 truncated A-type inclusion protein [Yokapox virus]
MEVDANIIKFTKHKDDFIQEVESKWDDELHQFSGLYRKTRNIIRNIIRDIVILTDDKKRDEFYNTFLSTKLNNTNTSIDKEYRYLFGNGYDIESRVNTIGKYILFVVMTYITSTFKLTTYDEVVDILSKLLNVICNIHDKYLCEYMFIGIPVSLINILNIKGINNIYTVLNQRYSRYVSVYDEFFLFLKNNHYMQSNKYNITLAYGPVSFVTSISVPDFIMESLTFKACDNFYKTDNLKYVYVFTRKIGVLSDGDKDEIYQYVKLTEMIHNGVVEDNDDYDDCSAVLNLDVNKHIDRFRNRLILLTPEIITCRKHGNSEDADPDYRYLIDVEIKNERMYISNQTLDLKTSSNDINLSDYQLVIDKLMEWIDNYDVQSENQNEKDIKTKIHELMNYIKDKIYKIKSLEWDSIDCQYMIKKIENELEEKFKTIKKLDNDNTTNFENNDDNDKNIQKIKDLEDKLEKCIKNNDLEITYYKNELVELQHKLDDCISSSASSEVDKLNKKINELNKVIEDNSENKVEENSENKVEENSENKVEENSENKVEENKVEENSENKVEENKVEENSENKVEENKVEENSENKVEENKVEENSENKVEENSENKVEENSENKVEENSENKVEENSENKVEENSENKVEENSENKVEEKDETIIQKIINYI